MSKENILKKQYNLFYNIDYTLIDYAPDKPFVRESSTFTLDEVQVIEGRPLYFHNGEKIINLIEYWQHSICSMLNSDIKRMDMNSVLVCSVSQPGYFYSSYFPFVGWRIITEDIFIKITGTIWIKNEYK